MDSKIVCLVLVALLAALQSADALKCFRCENEASCKKAKQYECNQTYANETMQYLDAYFQGVNTNTSSQSFACMRHDIKFPVSGNVKYKGCVYTHVNPCGYKFRPYFTQSSTSFYCHNCWDKHGCNPAGRTSASAAAVGLPLLFALIYKRLV